MLNEVDKHKLRKHLAIDNKVNKTVHNLINSLKPVKKSRSDSGRSRLKGPAWDDSESSGEDDDFDKEESDDSMSDDE